MVEFDDDGSGPDPPSLIVGGYFTQAGFTQVNRIARWDGLEWSAMDGGMNGEVFALAVFDDDGPGPRPPMLYAGGVFTQAGAATVHQLARWTGIKWEALPEELDFGDVRPAIRSLAVWDDDGAGPHPPALYAGGSIYSNANRTILLSHIAKFNGTSWSAVGDGLGGGEVNALRVLDEDGSGPIPAALFVGGGFKTTDGGATTLNGIAKWNGTSYSAYGNGIGPNGGVYAIEVYDNDADGPNPPMLVISGSFPPANIARWDGSAWVNMGIYQFGDVEALITFDPDANGPSPPLLYAGGYFRIGSYKGLAAWNGSNWSGVGPPAGTAERSVIAFCVHDPDDTGPALPELYLGGLFAATGDISTGNIARFNGSVWTALGSGLTSAVQSLYVFGDGLGPGGSSLYLGGQFTTAGSVQANRIARWDGVNYAALGSGVDGTIRAMAGFDTDGPGPNPPELYICGEFSNAGGNPASRIARWNGTAWSAVASGLSGGSTPRGSALAVFDEDGLGPIQPRLFVGGLFTVAGGVPINDLARWDGTTFSGVGGGINGEVGSMVVWGGPGHSSPALYVAGAFTSAGGVAGTTGIARWDGLTWSSVGGGFDYGGALLAVHDPDGPGPELESLYASGTFSHAGGVPVSSGFARWDGLTWTAVGGTYVGGNYPAHALISYDEDGAGPGLPRLFAAGPEDAQGKIVNYMASWNGTVWESVGGGLNYDGNALAVFDDDGPGPHAPALYVGGAMTNAGNVVSVGLARWGIPFGPPTGDINGDGKTDGLDIQLMTAKIVAASTDSVDLCRADFDASGVIDFGDIASFVEVMIGP